MPAQGIPCWRGVSTLGCRDLAALRGVVMNAVVAIGLQSLANRKAPLISHGDVAEIEEPMVISLKRTPSIFYCGASVAIEPAR